MMILWRMPLPNFLRLKANWMENQLRQLSKTPSFSWMSLTCTPSVLLSLLEPGKSDHSYRGGFRWYPGVKGIHCWRKIRLVDFAEYQFGYSEL